MGPIQTEWEDIPNFDALLPNFRATPGRDYAWVLIKNIGPARKLDGFEQIQLTDHEGDPVGILEPFVVAGLDVALLARGEGLPGARFEATAPSVFIDPELVNELKAKGLKVTCGDDPKPEPVQPPQHQQGQQKHKHQQEARR